MSYIHQRQALKSGWGSFVLQIYFIYENHRGVLELGIWLTVLLVAVLALNSDAIVFHNLRVF